MTLCSPRHDTRTPPLFTAREAASYAAAHVLRIAAVFALSSLNVFAPLYVRAFHSGGAAAIQATAIVLGAAWMALTFPLFLLARSLFGGTPPLVSHRGTAFATTGAEVGAYALAHLIGIIGTAVLAMPLVPVYTHLRQQGQTGLASAIGIAVALAVTAGMFALFVPLRRGFSRARPAATPDAPQPAAEWPDLVGVGGWLLFACICLTILGPAITAINIGNTLLNWPPASVLAQFTGVGVALVLEVLVQAGLMGFAIYAGSGLWSVRRGAVAMAKAYLVTQLAVAFVLPIIEVPIMNLPGSAAGTVLAQGAKGFIQSLIGFAIWYSYLSRSVRVRQTYPDG